MSSGHQRMGMDMIMRTTVKSNNSGYSNHSWNNNHLQGGGYPHPQNYYPGGGHPTSSGG